MKDSVKPILGDWDMQSVLNTKPSCLKWWLGSFSEKVGGNEKVN
jgi:hypothetical protein